MKQKSHIARLHELGLWNGPQDYLIKKLLRADQIVRSSSFMGVFEKNAFVNVPGMETVGTNVYLGKPGDLWALEVGRDKVRDPKTGDLHAVETDEHKTPEYYEAHKKIPVTDLPKRRKEITMPVKNSAEQLMVYPLDHTLQSPIIEPSSFDAYHVQVNGLGPLGLEISTQLSKMGLNQLTVYGPGITALTDPVSSGYRVFDPNRPRLNAAMELIADGSLCQIIESFNKFIDGQEEFGHIVINTVSDPEVRRQTWELVKASIREKASGEKICKVALFVDAQADGKRGRVFAFSPLDNERVKMFEEDLKIAANGVGETICMTRLTGSWATLVLTRFVATSGNAKDAVISNMFLIDSDILVTDEGAFQATK